MSQKDYIMYLNDLSLIAFCLWYMVPYVVHSVVSSGGLKGVTLQGALIHKKDTLNLNYGARKIGIIAWGTGAWKSDIIS